MESNIGNALLLLLVGMSTVYLMLFLLVSFGKVLIRWVNKINLDIHELPFTKLKTETSMSRHEAAIHLAIQKLTDHKAKVVSIEKLKS